MGRITTRRPVTRVSLTHGERRRPDTLAVEEPLEIRIAGEPLVITMRTPGHDVELAAGFLVSEGVVKTGGDFRSAIHCGGPGTNGLGMPEVGAPAAADAAPRSVLDTLRASDSGASASENTYNVLDRGTRAWRRAAQHRPVAQLLHDQLLRHVRQGVDRCRPHRIGP